MSPAGSPKDWAPRPLDVTDRRVKRFNKRLQDALEEADLAFWAKIAEAFPQAKSGDFPPDAHFRWSQGMEEAVLIWLDYNHPARRELAVLRQHFADYGALPR